MKVNTHVVAAAGLPPPADYHSSFQEAARTGLVTEELGRRLAPSTGVRNRVVHEYETIDLHIIADAIGEAVDGYREYVRVVAIWLRDRGGLA